MKTITELENKFMEALAEEVYGGTTFFDDVIKRTDVDSKTMRGAVASLSKKNIILIADDGMIGIVTDENDEHFPMYGVEWEINKNKVLEAMSKTERKQA